MDIDSSYLVGCTNEVGSLVKDALIGCSDGPIGKLLCGLSLEIKHGDISTVETTGNLFYPRVLIAAGEDHDGDGRTDPAMTCSDPIDCSQKCLYLERTARHGAGAPPSCALCDQACPSNVLSTINDIVTGLWEDVLTVVHLIGTCFGNHGLAGCICNFVSTLEPVWRRVSTSPIVRCENGDPFQLIVGQLNTLVIDWAQWAVNGLIDGVNGFLQALPWPLDFIGKVPGNSTAPKQGPFERACFDDPAQPRKCEGGGITVAEQQKLDECEDEKLKGGLDMTCYFHRVRFRYSSHNPRPPLTQCALPPSTGAFHLLL